LPVSTLVLCSRTTIDAPQGRLAAPIIQVTTIYRKMCGLLTEEGKCKGKAEALFAGQATALGVT